MEENELICMVGLPRSGKTTVARALRYPIVNRDSIRLALHGYRYIAEAEELVAAITKIMVKALFLAGHRTVVVDETNTTRKRRNFWRSEDWRTRYFHIKTSPLICHDRATAEGDQEIMPIIDRMASQFEPLEQDEEVYERQTP